MPAPASSDELDVVGLHRCKGRGDTVLHEIGVVGEERDVVAGDLDDAWPYDHAGACQPPQGSADDQVADVQRVAEQHDPAVGPFRDRGTVEEVEDEGDTVVSTSGVKLLVDEFSAMYIAVMALAIRHLPAYHPFPQFGSANQVTTVRAGSMILAAIVWRRAVAIISAPSIIACIIPMRGWS